MAKGHQLKMARCENRTFVHPLSRCVGRREGLGEGVSGDGHVTVWWKVTSVKPLARCPRGGE